MKNNLAGNYALANDIDCSNTTNWNGGAGFEPVGWYVTGSNNAPFTGTFDGQDYKVLDLVIYRPGSNCVGLFGYTVSSANIYSVGLVAGAFRGNSYVGGLVGLNSASLTDVYTTGSMTGSAYVGGVVGFNLESSTFTRTYATGNVTSSGNYVGGLVGANQGGFTTFISVYATGNVLGSGEYVGGLLGYDGATAVVISNAYATGAVTGSNHVGGLLGRYSGYLNNAYAIGRVVGDTNPLSKVGGLIGYSPGVNKIKNSYWDTETSGQASSIGGTGKATAQMYQKATFVGWDFYTIWWLHENNDYPQLRPITPPPVRVIQPISDKTNAIGQLFVFIVPENTMQDSSDPSLNYTVSLLGSSSLPPWLTFTTSTRAFSGTPLTGAQGNYTIEVIATNDDEYSESDFFILMVTNRAPQQNIPLVAQSLNVGDTLSYALPANSFSDGDADPLAYTAQLSGGGALPIWLDFNASSFIFSGVPLSGDQSVLIVQIIVDDGFGGSVSDTFTLTVNNQPPTVQTSISTQYATNGELFQFVIPGATFDDVDGDSLNLTAMSTGGGALPGWLTFTPGTQTFSGTPPVRGSYPITVTADDGFGGQVSTNFDVIVPNQIPVLVGEISSQEAVIDGAFSFSFADDLFSDPDNDMLQYSAQLENGDELPSWLNFDGTQREFFGTPSKDDKGTLVIDIIANDGYGGNATASFGVTVFGDSGSGGLTDGQIAAVVISIIGSVLGMLYTGYKFYKKRQFYKGEGENPKSTPRDDKQMTTIAV